jgi:2,3-bisphosphoglycerate-independent phosphoglycerate mutase
MTDADVRKRIVPGDSKIVLLVLDGLGGLPLEPGGLTELETARTPNLDRLAALSNLGLSQPAGPGVTVGSGPGHLALFGYDPYEYEIGRGALEALGVDFELGPDDLAARGNFCTVDERGVLLDRRAGRLPTEASLERIHLLRQIQLDGAECFVEPVKEHRFAFVLRAPGLSDALTDSDPLQVGVPTLPVCPEDEASQPAAVWINQFLLAARLRLMDQAPANMITLRGFNKAPQLPSFQERYRLNAAAIAVNGMYRGVSRLAGMRLLPVMGTQPADEFAALEQHWPEHDFFYLHIKQTDTCGEAGDFAGKAGVIEQIDALIPRILALDPDVLIVTGDHSSPALLRSHSWHPVPLLLYSKLTRGDRLDSFGERACARGSLGLLPAQHILLLALGHARRIAKYGA